MAPPSNSSDSESDAPETVALSNSRKSAKKDTARIQAAKSAAKLQNKLKNREKDRKLKERAEKTRGIPNAEEAVDPEVADVDEDSGSEEAWNGVESDASSSYSQSASTEEEGDIEDDEDHAMEDLSQSKHLPDHLFSSAFSSISTKNPPLKPSKAKAAHRPKKHRRPLGRPKDIIVGFDCS
ncbi:hypothetical protein ONZ45_g8357 [Pleurotus djamor]|nr:hypothetical protein ONZ45_g8357 [Pleurotus djamor]